MQISVQSAKQNLGIEPAPHLHCQMSTTRIMIIVLLSLIPALGVMTYFFGSGTVIQFFIAAITAITCQVLTAIMRSRSIKRAFKDPSGVVTALLLALTLPPLLPWYFTIMATAFAMLLVRECFGGLGMNIFNPAMSGFIFLVISAPGIFYTTWVSPTPGAMYVATPSRAMDVIFDGKDPQILIQEIRELNRLNEHEAARTMALESQAAATAKASATTTDNTTDSKRAADAADTTAQSAAADTNNTATDAVANEGDTATSTDAATSEAAEASASAENAANEALESEATDAAEAESETATVEHSAYDDEMATLAAVAAASEATELKKLEKAAASGAAHTDDNDFADVDAFNEAANKTGSSAVAINHAKSQIANADANEAEAKMKSEQERLKSEAVIEIDGRFTADALTGATFLESIKTSRKAEAVEKVDHVDFTGPSFMAYAWLAGAYVLGGLVLIFTGCIRFQVPLAFLAAVAGTAALWHHYDPAMSINTVEHLLMGGTMLGAFYIITDPVTTCGTFKGRIILSAFIGFLAVVMRINGSYSDSIAFAVMLGNCLAPLMDVMTKRRPFGIGYRPGGLD